MYLATIYPWVLAFAHPSQPGSERLGVVRRSRDKGKEIHFFVRAWHQSTNPRHTLQNPSRKKREMRSLAAGAPLVPDEKARLETCMGYVPIHHMARMSSGTGMARASPFEEPTLPPHADVDLARSRAGIWCSSRAKAVVSRGSPTLGCGDSRSADSRSSLVHSPVQSMDGVCKPLPSSTERFVSRGLTKPDRAFL
jgi:hypothetical protein